MPPYVVIWTSALELRSVYNSRGRPSGLVPYALLGIVPFFVDMTEQPIRQEVASPAKTKTKTWRILFIKRRNVTVAVPAHARSLHAINSRSLRQKKRTSSPRPSPPSDGGEGASAPARRGVVPSPRDAGAGRGSGRGENFVVA